MNRSERPDYKARSMDFHVISYMKGTRYIKRTFPQSPYQRDYRANLFMNRLIGSLMMMGINYDLKIIDRAEYIATHYDRNPYRAPIPEPFEEADIHTISYTFLGCNIVKTFNRSQISDVFGCLKMLQRLGLPFHHDFTDQ